MLEFASHNGVSCDTRLRAHERRRRKMQKSRIPRVSKETLPGCTAVTIRRMLRP
jgi:hypothetical protein